jgi:hypothetical protein
MSTKHVESEARVMSPVLIEGLAEIKRLYKATKYGNIVRQTNVLGKGINTVGAAMRNAREPKTVFVLRTASRQVS